MAIVINGSGTVTGISVGGLPDDIVDAGMMADNSIDSDMYVDASIDNAHLADDAVGVAELSATGTASATTFLRGDNSWAAAGNANGILKEVAYDEVATIAGSQTSWASGNTVTFVKEEASADSIIVYSWNGYLAHHDNRGSYIDWRMGYTPDGGSIAYTDIRALDWYSKHADSNDTKLYFPINYQIVIATLAAGSHTFVMQCRWGGGDDNNSQFATDTHHNILIREVLI